DMPLAGFRVYDTFAEGDADRPQVVAVWDIAGGALQGLVLGTRLGELRTGAIGGVAIRCMAGAEAAVVGGVGSGAQARTQLMAAAAVRRLRDVRVYSRSSDRRRAFASEMRAQLGLTVTPVAAAQDAVAAADIVICATDSAVPVIEATWLKPGAHVT